MNILIWPDDTWCREENMWEYDWKSDDYVLKETDLSDNEIEDWIKHEMR
jgi:hypothetical protein